MNKKKKDKVEYTIGIYIADNRPSGITRYAINLKKTLNKKGYKVVLIADTNKSVENIDDFKFLSLNENFNKKNIFNRILSLRNVIVKHNINLVISNGWYHDFIALNSSLTLKQNVPVVGVIHTHPQLWNLGKGLKKTLKSKIIRMIYRNQIKTIVVSKSLGEYVHSKGWVKDEIILYNPVISNVELSYSKVRTIEKKELNLCTLGWISPIKGLDVAIKAFNKLISQVPSTLTIIGDVSDYNYFLKIKAMIKEYNIEEKIIFTGPLDNPYEILNKMDIFLLPSRSEALPTALIESMALGLPCIATDCKFGPSEILDNGKYGVLIPVDDYIKLKDEIINLYNNKKVYENLSKIGIERSHLFCYDAIGEQYDELLLDILK